MVNNSNFYVLALHLPNCLKSLVSLFLVPDLFYWLPMQLLIVSGYFVFSSEIL